jgi:hypothetical protein
VPPSELERLLVILLYATPVPGDVGVAVECHPVSWGMAVFVPLVQTVHHSILLKEVLHLRQAPVHNSDNAFKCPKIQLMIRIDLDLMDPDRIVMQLIKISFIFKQRMIH